MLPHYGGVASVWLSCLAAYQLLLLLGSAYSLLHTRLSPALSRRMHIALLFLSLLYLAAALPGRGRIMDGIAALSLPPSLSSFLAVLALAGIPFVFAAAGSSLFQLWHNAAFSGNSYRLYAISNLGSFTGLFAFPLLLEPCVSVTRQCHFLLAVFALYFVFALAVALKGASPAASSASGTGGKPGKGRVFLYLAIPFFTTALLNSVTAHLTTDVSPAPLAWALVLGAFLLSYIIGFSSIGEKRPVLWLFLSAAAVLYSLGIGDGKVNTVSVFGKHFFAGIALMLSGGTLLHGCLYRLRPHSSRLVFYYFMISLGGALGGVVSGVLPPVFFNAIWEYHISLLAMGIVCLFLLWRLRGDLAGLLGRFVSLFSPGTAVSGKAAGLLSVLCFLSVAIPLAARVNSRVFHKSIRERHRSFYGSYRVSESSVGFGQNHAGADGGAFRFVSLESGNTIHGVQIKQEAMRREPGTYYGKDAGGMAFSLHPKYGKEKVDALIVGLGAGSQAAYLNEGDSLTFLEIDPVVAKIATNSFSFIADSKGSVEIKTGDGRKLLENDPKKYDILVIDAYSGDSVPLHLVTKEAFGIYLGHLKEDGILALHISNWHLDLLSAAKAVMAEFSLEGRIRYSKNGFSSTQALWVFLSRNSGFAKDSPYPLFSDWSGVVDRPILKDGTGSLLPYVIWRPRRRE